MVTLFSAIDLVVGTSKMARLHEFLARRFIDLEKKIISIPQEQFSANDFNQLTTERLDIEADEPPVKQVLDSLCQNELLRSMGYGREEFVHVAIYQRLFAQFFDIMEHRIKKYGQPAS